MQKYVLNEIADPSLQLYIVWGPMMGGEKQEDAKQATVFLADQRARHFWTSEEDIARAFAQPLGLEQEPAWDTFLVYSSSAAWAVEDTPPEPSFFMHVGRSLPAEKRLNGETLAEEIRKLLKNSGEAAVVSR